MARGTFAQVNGNLTRGDGLARARPVHSLPKRQKITGRPSRAKAGEPRARRTRRACRARKPDAPPIRRDRRNLWPGIARSWREGNSDSAIGLTWRSAQMTLAWRLDSAAGLLILAVAAAQPLASGAAGLDASTRAVVPHRQRCSGGAPYRTKTVADCVRGPRCRGLCLRACQSETASPARPTTIPGHGASIVLSTMFTRGRPGARSSLST